MSAPAAMSDNWAVDIAREVQIPDSSLHIEYGYIHQENHSSSDDGASLVILIVSCDYNLFSQGILPTLLDKEMLQKVASLCE